MAFGETKVYYDGSHYIAIPHTERPKRYRPKTVEEEITVVDTKEQGSDTDKATEPLIPCKTDEMTDADKVITDGVCEAEMAVTPSMRERKLTKRELFDKLYDEYLDLPKKERALKIMDGLFPYFDSVEQLKWYVDLGMERKYRNIVARRVRMVRKANLADFNYFCTFTYDDKKHTEETFKKKLKNKLSLLAYRQGWRYMGVWERSPEKKRLHFHGLFNVPDNAMVGELVEKTDFSTVTHTMQTINLNTYFEERFGRNDFKELDKRLLGESLAYLMKYIEKTGERIVYSKGMYQYFISDIMDEDIVSTIGQEDKKLLLFDDFNCWDEGVLMGKVSPEVIAKMRKCN